LKSVAIFSRLNDPTAPKMKAVPNKNIAEANEPIKKYLNAASFDAISFFLLPASTYTGKDITSMPRNNIVKLVKEVRQKAPVKANKINEK
jgi:hypothetical protein